MFTSLALEGIHRKQSLYEVLNCSQGNLETKEEPRITNKGQIMYRKTLLGQSQTNIK